MGSVDAKLRIHDKLLSVAEAATDAAAEIIAAHGFSDDARKLLLAAGAALDASTIRDPVRNPEEACLKWHVVWPNECCDTEELCIHDGHRKCPARRDRPS